MKGYEKTKLRHRFLTERLVVHMRLWPPVPTAQRFEISCLDMVYQGTGVTMRANSIYLHAIRELVEHDSKFFGLHLFGFQV